MGPAPRRRWTSRSLNWCCTTGSCPTRSGSKSRVPPRQVVRAAVGLRHQAYLTATGLNESFAPALDGLVRGLKDEGLWAKMQAIYPFIGGTEALHKWNLKDPRDLDAAYRLTFSRRGHALHGFGLPTQRAGSAVYGSSGRHTLRPVGRAQSGLHPSVLYSLRDVPPAARCEIGCYNWAGRGSGSTSSPSTPRNGSTTGMAEDGATQHRPRVIGAVRDHSYGSRCSRPGTATGQLRGRPWLHPSGFLRCRSCSVDFRGTHKAHPTYRSASPPSARASNRRTSLTYIPSFRSSRPHSVGR